MDFIFDLLPFIQIVLAIALVAMVLLQRSEAGVGGTFGGDDGGSGHFARRGFEKTLFIGTIVVAILFTVSAFLALWR